jgi:hypothetical protein
MSAGILKVKRGDTILARIKKNSLGPPYEDVVVKVRSASNDRIHTDWHDGWYISHDTNIPNDELIGYGKILRIIERVNT